MKKLFLIGALVATFAISAVAQVQHKSYPLINPYIKTLVCTNAIGISNLVAIGANTTNWADLTWTNTYGDRMIVKTNAGLGTWANTKFNPFVDAPLWSLRDGAWPVMNVVTNGTELNTQRSFVTLNLSWVASSGANAAVTFIFSPIYNGKNEATAAADKWTISFTPTASATQVLSTNVPVWRWPGARALRLLSISNADTDASGDVALSDLSVNGFVPVD